MKILGIETSCDETGVALIEAPEIKKVENKKLEIKVLANLLRSQIELHKPYGGVYPNLAKREHAKNLPELWKRIKKEKLDDKIDLIAVTEGPGLSPCLWEGINFAEKLSEELKVPVVGVNHLKGHIYIALIEPLISKLQSPNYKQTLNNKSQTFKKIKFNYPILSLIVSGGHTELVFSEKPGHYKILGRTRDDAAGEAFDKVARLLGLDYPGGPEISRRAESGDSKKFDLPRPMINSKDFDFSFAGLKTAMVYLVKGFPSHSTGQESLKLTKRNINDLSASFQRAVVDVLVSKTIKASQKYKPRTIVLGGGVAANKLLRDELKIKVDNKLENIELILPDPKLTTDNGLMIALTAWYEKNILKSSEKTEKLRALPNWRIDQVD